MLLYLLELYYTNHMLAEHIIEVMADRNQNDVIFYKFQGIGRRYANVVCKKADVDITKRAGELSEEEVC